MSKIAKLTVNIECGNDSFDNENQELAAILEKIAKDIRNGADMGTEYVRDTNGNTVGSWFAELDEE